MEVGELVHSHLPQLYVGPDAGPEGDVPPRQPDLQLSNQIGFHIFFKSVGAEKSDGAVERRLLADVPATRRPDHSDLVTFSVQLLNKYFHVYPVTASSGKTRIFPVNEGMGTCANSRAMVSRGEWGNFMMKSFETLKQHKQDLFKM